MKGVYSSIRLCNVSFPSPVIQNHH
jgi:hypothetical protein